jgi:hypothetical protein
LLEEHDLEGGLLIKEDGRWMPKSSSHMKYKRERERKHNSCVLFIAFPTFTLIIIILAAREKQEDHFVHRFEVRDALLPGPPFLLSKYIKRVKSEGFVDIFVFKV